MKKVLIALVSSCLLIYNSFAENLGDKYPEKYPVMLTFDLINEYQKELVPFNRIEINSPLEWQTLRKTARIDMGEKLYRDYLLHSKFFKKSKFYMMSALRGNSLSTILGNEIGSDTAFVIELCPENLNKLIEKEGFNLKNFSDQEIMDYAYELFMYSRNLAFYFWTYNLPTHEEMKYWRNPIENFSPEVISKYKEIFEQKKPYILRCEFGILLECYLYIRGTMTKRILYLRYDGTFEFFDVPIVDADKPHL